MRFLVKAFVAFCVCATGITGVYGSDNEDNLGQDATRPRSRLDLRVQYQQVESDVELVRLTARIDQPITIGNGWKLNTRVSQGFFFSDLPSSDNIDRETEEGFGDLLTQAFFIPPSDSNVSFGFGLRAIFPTATQDQLGSGKYSLVPIGVVLHFPTWLASGSFIGVGVRNQVGFGGDKDRKDINELQIAPIVNIRLPRKSFVSFFPTIRRDWKNQNDVFVPFDLAFGRAIGRGKIGSLRLQVPLIDKQNRYDWTLEARVTFLF
ncbi:MAG TPA: hypothetical protein DGR97_12190 [Gammaproteobacteria bacterium]|nr:hypothetical protein [Gammaproteobacteria bacterium]|tara:strand:- start:884 stop:1672 length:789 start_codon:yes stop_codon:yes gene_type:complete